VFGDEIYPLSTYQNVRFESCYQLLLEDKVSLDRGSLQRKSKRIRVRNLLVDVLLGLGSEVFLLCTLATTITQLAIVI
jgi:hypothetical protein